MEQMKMHSPNFTDENIQKLAALFPNCITEAKDKHGNTNYAVDFDLLRQELSDSLVDGPQERYHLNWPGKRQALLTANAPIAKTLRPCRKESVDFDTTQNLFIEGDNLDALKLLQETYLGKVQLIYIDPPYNTGNDFIYNDKFSISNEEYLLESGQLDENKNKLIANPESNGRFHSDWLSMLYPRLKLARNLLTDTGAIVISIDDSEYSNLKRVCDEIFGEANFKASVSWQKRYTRSNNTVDFTTVIEPILIYSKSNDFTVNLLPRTGEADARYTNPDNDPRGPWKGASFLNPAAPHERPNLCYPIRNPNTGEETLPTSNAWRRSQEEFKKLQSENKLYWGSDGKQRVPSIKMFLSEARGLTPINFWPHDYAGNTDDGTKEFSNLLDGKIFNNPKPTKLIQRIIEHTCDNESIVLDFFAGTSTTAHSIMKMNAHDNGNRKFIMVQLPEECAPQSAASQKGYKTIAEISKERIRRAGQKILEENPLSTQTLDTGFRVLKIDSSNMEDVYYSPDTMQQDLLNIAASNVKAGRTEEDLLFQVLLDWGVDLSLPIAQKTIAGNKVYFVDENVLAACFTTNGKITEDFIKELAKEEPLRVVFRDAGFKNDSAKINTEQIFNLMSPHTEIKTI